MGKLRMIAGNIVDDDILKTAEAVVLPTNPMMRCGAGIFGEIFKKAGVDILEAYCEKTYGISYYNEPGVNEMKVTETRVTPGFALPCPIIFAQGPKKYEYADDDAALCNLKRTYESIFETVKSEGFRSVLIPAMGTGSYGFTHEETAPLMVGLLSKFADENDIDIVFVVYDESDLPVYLSELDRLRRRGNEKE